jgi:glycosyltransferase involved in cell wall biosynthesis
MRPAPARPKIVFATNSAWNLINFRAPIIKALQERGYQVLAAAPEDKHSSALRSMDVQIHHVNVDARGFSPLADARLYFSYRTLLKRLQPAAVLGFTVKPNIYGSRAAAELGIPVINTLTGLGTAFLSGRVLEGGVSILYRWGLKRSHRVFFHNRDDCDLFVTRGLVTPFQARVVAGSGIDLHHFSSTSNPTNDDRPTFLFIGRLLKDKGAMEFAQAAEIVRKTRRARFQMLGAIEDHPKAVSQAALERFIENGSIELLAPVEDVRPVMAAADCIVLPSYREGLPRVLLEASAMAIPVIATDVPGCRQAVDDGVTGLLCEPRSALSLAESILRVSDMTSQQRCAMGEYGRQKAAREFSKERVVAAYLDTLQEIGI